MHARSPTTELCHDLARLSAAILERWRSATALAVVPSAVPVLTSSALVARLTRALRDGEAALDLLRRAEPIDRRDRFLSLLTIYDLHTAPLEVVGDAARHQHAPAVAEVKGRLERAWLDELDLAQKISGTHADSRTVAQAVRAMRAVAAKDRLPHAYKWLATTTTWDELVDFLTLEGGPDGGFDDSSPPARSVGQRQARARQKLLARDGCGDAAGVHTVLHQDMAAAVGMPHVKREDLPVEALERAAVGGLLATNRWLQLAMVGALGLPELQAGPRCRLVLQAFERLSAPVAAYRFCVEARRDPPRARQGLDGQGRRPAGPGAARQEPAHRQRRLMALDGEAVVLRGAAAAAPRSLRSR